VVDNGDVASTPFASAGPGFPRVASGPAWMGSTLASGFLGWQLLAIADRHEDVLLAWFLLGLAMLGVVAVGAVTSNRRRWLTLTFSIVASSVFVIAGVVAMAIVAARGQSGVDDRLLIGALSIVSGVVSGLLGLRARSLAR
jgi:cell division protein FtsW (lipid II flippase)